jgi:protease IV
LKNRYFWFLNACNSAPLRENSITIITYTNMRDFFRLTLTSCLGVFAAFAGLFLVAIIWGAVAVATGSGNGDTAIKKNAVLELKFDKPIPEKTDNSASGGKFSFNTDQTIGLNDIVKSIRNAKTDDKIKGIFLNLELSGMGGATASVVRRELLDFKTSGKWIYAYSESYTQGEYYLASVADKVFLHPLSGVTSGIDFKGMGVVMPFYKGLLDKLEIKPQIFYAGKFKSATEPFRLEKMSTENRTQLRELINDFYGSMLQEISTSRNIPVPELRKIADNLMIRTPKDAINFKMVDELMYRDQVISYIKAKIGVEDKTKIPFVSLEKYADTLDKDAPSGSNRIAVITAEGEIINSEEDDPGVIQGTRYAKLLEKVRKDDKVKAVVLRVNSPGGDAVASENMWREVKLLKEAGKPVVVSMGDYAASGGYYIACAADSIFAEKRTLTGSIGVFAMMFSIEKALKSKLGVTFDTLKTGKFSQGIAPLELTKEQGDMLQHQTEQMYEVFLSRVAEGRHKTRDAVHEIAQGRVWTGTKGVELGLVDRIGTLDDAIKSAAKLAKLDTYGIKEYPYAKDKFRQMIDKFTKAGGNDTKAALLKSELRELYPMYEAVQNARRANGRVLARLPFNWVVE